MKKAFFHILSGLLLSASFCFGQNEAPVSFGFADSLRIVMENTRNLDATAVGASLVTAWDNIGLDQQQIVKRQTARMRKKGYKLRPHLVPYFGALAAAVNIEGADITQLANFLKVSGKVIENYTAPRALTFFSNSREFFEQHALYADKS